MTSPRITISTRQTWMVLALAMFQVHLIVGEQSLVFNLQEENLYKRTKDNIFITCSKPANAATAINMQWINPKQQPIIATSGRVRTETSAKNAGVDLVFEKIEVSDKGVYKCVAKVDGHSLSRSFNLHVSVPISFAGTEPVQWVAENTNNSINCTVGGDPMPSITWKKFPNHELKDPRFRPEQEKLFISNIRRSDAGEYVCKAMQTTQAIPSFNDTVITVKIKFKPEWPRDYDTEERVLGFLDGTTNLTCEANSEPEPKFEWSRGENDIDMEDIIISGIDNKYIFTEPNSSVLQIHIDSEQAFGNYRCTVYNPLGRIHRNIILQQTEKPQPPEIKLRHQGHDRVEIELSPSDDSSDIIAYLVEYRLGKDDWDKASSGSFSKGEPVVLTQLEQNETYLMRVKTKSKAGYGDSSKDFPFQTLMLQPTPSVKDNGRNGCAASTSFMAVLIMSLFRFALTLYIV